MVSQPAGGSVHRTLLVVYYSYFPSPPFLIQAAATATIVIQSAATVAIVILADAIAAAIVIQATATTIVNKATNGFSDWAVYSFFILQSTNT